MISFSININDYVESDGDIKIVTPNSSHRIKVLVIMLTVTINECKMSSNV